MQNKEEINILLLSETGIGKSTFINSLVNYLQFNTFEDACEQIQQLHCIIPTKFIVMDDHLYEKTVECGSNDNESTAKGASATLKTKSYLIKAPTLNITLRIIDTPGIGDTQGIMQDTQNQQDIMNYLSCITYLNAICILLKPNQARCTIPFQYCFNQVLSYLHKSAIGNIMFVFTSTSNTFFTPGETIHALQKVLKYIELKQNIVIPFKKENTFCVDNEAFRFLLARKYGIKLGNEKIFANSFSHSKSEFLRLIHQAKSATAHLLNDTIFLSGVKRKFEDLCHHLNDMLDLLKSNAALLKKLHDMSVDVEKGDITDIESRMCKTETEKNNVIRQISKFVVFLKANSVVLFNDYSQGYITYLIDQEMSKDTEVNRQSLRNYRNLLSYYENIKEAIKMDTHTDILLPSLICDELSTLYPELNKKDSASNILNNEVEVSLTEENLPVEEDNQKEEEKSEPFSFDDWFEQIQQSATRLSNNIEKGIECDVFRKRFVKREFNSNTNQNVNNPNYQKFDESDSKHPNVRFKKNPKSSDGASSKPSNERYRRKRNDKTDGILGARSSSLCMLDQLDSVSTEKNDDFVYIHKTNDDFVFLDKVDTQNTRSRGGFRGRSRGKERGRGRGRGGGNTEGNQLPKRGRGSNSSKTYANNTRESRPNTSRGNSSWENRNTELPKNVLQSMTSIFD